MLALNPIKVQQPFNWNECLWYLDRGFDDCIYRVLPNKVRRAFNFKGEAILIDVSFNNDALHLELLAGMPGPEGIAYAHNFIANWFDLKRDLLPFYNLLAVQNELSYMVESFNGLRFIGIPDLFESLVWTIMGQQINLNFAYKIKRRFVETYGSYIEFEDNKYWIFPPPEKIVRLSVPQLRELQLSNSKAEYILNIARAFVSGSLSKEILLNLPDFITRQKLLTDIKGIGTWTANYVLMKSLKENSAVPYGDAGLPKALVAHGLITDKKDHINMAKFYQAFSGWESYMSLYLWRSMSNKS